MMLTVPYFGGAEIEVFDEDGDLSDPQAMAVLEAFLTLTPADRLRDTRHVYAYYRDFREAVGGEEWLDKEMGVPETPEDIWSHIQPGMLGVWRGRSDDPNYYVYLEAVCSWEIEHGLLLVWRNGLKLNKAGGFDGHPTNSSAHADNQLGDVVYSAINSAYTTRLGEG